MPNGINLFKFKSYDGSTTCASTNTAIPLVVYYTLQDMFGWLAVDRPSLSILRTKYVIFYDINKIIFFTKKYSIPIEKDRFYSHP